MNATKIRNYPQAGVIFKNDRAIAYFYDDVTTYETERIAYNERNYIQFYKLETVDKMLKFLELMQCKLCIPEIEV